MVDPTYADECDECGATVRKNQMGQTGHRCDYKEASAEAASRIAEALLDEADYWVFREASLRLSVRVEDGDDFERDYRIVSDWDQADKEGSHVYTEPSETYAGDQDAADGYVFDLTEYGSYPVLIVEDGYRGQTVLQYEEELLWVTDAEIHYD